jgi:hypothetical protein
VKEWADGQAEIRNLVSSRSFGSEEGGDNANSYYTYEVVSNGMAVYLLLERCGALAEQKSSG